MKNKKQNQEIAQKHGLYVQKNRIRASKLAEEEAVEIIEPTRKPHLDKKLKEELQFKAKEEQQVIVNCNYTPFYGSSQMRIWPSTYLFSQDGKRLGRLVKSFNIGIYPNWSFVPYTGTDFTLIFEPLPKDINVFNVVEVIPEPGEFVINGIRRNTTDVYEISIG